MEIFAILVSLLTVAVTVIQYLVSRARQKKTETMKAYIQLQNEVFSKLNIIFSTLTKPQLYSLEKGDKEWEEITSCLAKLESFCVGINDGIYSIRILNRIGGGYFIRIYEDLLPIILKKRRENVSQGNHYDELEKAVARLKRIRKRKGN